MTDLAALHEVEQTLEATQPRGHSAYSAYKPSGVEWLGDVPEHWETLQLRRNFRLVNGSTPSSSEDRYWDGDIVWVTPDDLGSSAKPEIVDSRRRITREGYESCGATLAPRGSVVVSTRAPIGHLGIADVPLCTNQGCRTLVPTSALDTRFYYYQLLAGRPELESRGRGSTFTELSRTELSSVVLASPPLEEQQAIARFLDERTKRIDELIEAKRKLLDLLKEKRQAVITHAVTKGLDPNAKLKPSGIDWLGDVPEHWDIAPLMHRTELGHRIMYGIVLPGPHLPGGVPIVKGGDVDVRRLQRELLQCTDPKIESGYARSRLRAGDLVYGIRGSIGACEIVPPDCEGANITQDAAKIAPDHSVDRRWLLYALKSEALFAQLESRALGSTIRGINIRDLKRCKLPVPPRPEQEAIAEHLGWHIGELDCVVDLVNRAVFRLREYRSTLVSAAVTGKIDVRGESP